MNRIGMMPYLEVEIDKSGNLVHPVALKTVSLTEDLFVMVHGWNSDIDDARALYRDFFTEFSRVLERYGAPGVSARQCTVVGILWPSEKFADPALTPGGAAGLGSTGAMLLRAASYKAMKERAGTVGRRALASVLRQVQDAFPRVRIHLVAHSFGCRAIASAAACVPHPVASMTLLQGAMSNNSFSPDFDSTHRPGGFRGVVAERRCAGPMLITYSVHDAALRLCYPIASRLLRQNSSGLGGENDLYGALGHSGARGTPEACDVSLLEPGSCYAFGPGRIFNLEASGIIQAHADIVKPEVAWALISAAGLGRC